MRETRFHIRTLGVGVAGAFFIAGTILLSPLLRSWYQRWGATQAEANRSLPGDEYVPNPKSELTLAITIHAPAAEVWPWFAQLGCQRAGWYSYDLLDNGGISSEERILPEHQHLQVGDLIKTIPNGSFGFPVAAFEPGKYLVLGGTLDTRIGKSVERGESLPETYFGGDQAFCMEDIGGKTSRLIFRNRTDWNSSSMNNLIYRGIVEPISFVMARKMLLNVRRIAEV